MWLAALWGVWLRAGPVLAGAAPRASDTAGRGPRASAPVELVEVDLEIHPAGARPGRGTHVRAWTQRRRVPPGRAHVLGRATYHLAKPANGPVVLLDFASSLRAPPEGLDPVAERAFLDGPHDSGWTRLHPGPGVSRIRRRTDGAWEVVPVPGARSFTVSLETRVPRRPWPFGCVRGRCALAGAVAPLPSAPARGGPWLAGGRVVAPARWRVRAHLVADAPRDLEVVVAGAGPRPVHYPTVLWGPRWREVSFDHRGVHVRVLHLYRRPAGHAPDEWIASLRRDVAGRMSAVARETLDLLDAAGLPAPPGRELLLVQGPMRAAPAQDHPGVVLVSDEAFEVVPLFRFLRFHELALARATLGSLWLSELAARADPSSGLWLSGMLTEPLVALWQEHRNHPDEYARDLLRNLTFMPVVDRFLYTGQAAFSASYFRDLSRDPGRVLHPLWFSHALPDGKVLHGKLVDTLPHAALAHAYRALMADPLGPVQARLERAYGHTLGWFFEEWLGPPPSVNYAIDAVRSRPVRDGYAHTIVVRKKGRRPVLEPVQVLVEARGGEQHYLVWNGELDPSGGSILDEPREGTHTFTLHTRGRLQVVRLDPRYRLHETPQPPARNVIPRFDNRVPPSPRFLYTGAGLFVSASEFGAARTAAARAAAVDAFVFFEASKRNDVRATGHIQAFHDRETWGGASAGVNLWQGPLVNRRRRRRRVGLFQTVESLNGMSLDPRGGVRLVETLSLVDDDRGFFMWPQRGQRMELGVAARQTLRTEGSADHRYDLFLRGSYSRLFSPARSHVLGLNLEVAGVVPLAGTRPEFRSLVRGGGLTGLRAYTGNEIFGLAGLWVEGEYRHEFARNLHVNLLNVLWVRGVGGVLFAGAGTFSACDSLRGWFGRKSWYGQVGYGLTARTFILGITPQLVRLDVSVPLGRRSTRCLGERLPDYLAQVQGVDRASALLPPVAINLQFVQPF